MKPKVIEDHLTTLEPGCNHICNAGDELIIFKLPDDAKLCDAYMITGYSPGGWAIIQSDNQVIYSPCGGSTSPGQKGILSPASCFDSLKIISNGGWQFYVDPHSMLGQFTFL